MTNTRRTVRSVQVFRKSARTPNREEWKKRAERACAPSCDRWYHGVWYKFGYDRANMESQHTCSVTKAHGYTCASSKRWTNIWHWSKAGGEPSGRWSEIRAVWLMIDILRVVGKRRWRLISRFLSYQSKRKSDKYRFNCSQTKTIF